MTPRRSRANSSFCVRTDMPSATGSVQEALSPFRPSTSTMHSLQEPKASRLSVEQSFGIMIPASRAARIMEVPLGTVNVVPSTVNDTMTSSTRLGAGVPKSLSSRLMRLFPEQSLLENAPLHCVQGLASCHPFGTGSCDP